MDVIPKQLNQITTLLEKAGNAGIKTDTDEFISGLFHRIGHISLFYSTTTPLKGSHENQQVALEAEVADLNVRIEYMQRTHVSQWSPHGFINFMASGGAGESNNVGS